MRGWEQSHACQLHYTLRAPGTGVKPVTREPSTGVTGGRGPPGLSLPRTSGQTGELVERKIRWGETESSPRPT